MAEEHGLETAQIFFGSAIGGAILGAIIGTAQTSGTNELGQSTVHFAINQNGGYLSTAIGWAVGCFYEAFYRDNGLALLLLIPAVLLAGYVATQL